MKRQVLHPAIAAAEEQPLSLEAANARLSRAPTPEEIEATRELVRWFTTRYPTAKERFAYVNRKYKEWTQQRPK